MKPPATLDGAKVLSWAWSGRKPFGVIENTNGGVAAEVHGLAICKYDDGHVYRFSCDRQWEVQQDADHNSVDEAKRNLPEQYKNVPVEWIDYIDS